MRKLGMRAIRASIRKMKMVRLVRLQHKYLVHLRPNLTRQLRSTRRVVNSRRPVRVCIPVIETNHYQAFHVLGVAKALQLRGAEVLVLLCGSRLDGCEIKSSRNQVDDPCQECRFNHQKVVPLFGLKSARLSDYISDAEVESIREQAAKLVRDYPESFRYLGVDLIPIVDDSVVRHYYGGVPLSAPLELAARRRDHLSSAMMATTVAHRISESWSPDVFFSNMSAYSPFAPFREVARIREIPFKTISLSILNEHAVVVNFEELFASRERYDRYIGSRSHARLTAAEAQELQSFLDSRFKGKAAFISKKLGWFDAAPVNPLASEPRSNKRVIALFPNVFWDVGLSDRNSMFAGVVEWVLATVRIVAEAPDCELIVKVHPAERLFGESSERGIEDFIRAEFPKLPQNLTIIRAEDKRNPYDLLTNADIGVVYNGTIGLEMMFLDVPVIICGRSVYNGFGLGAEPRNLLEYADFLLGRREIPRADPTERDLLAYFYFIKAQVPWTLTEKAIADNFRGFSIGSLDEILPGNSPYVDHLCNCILDGHNTVVEEWTSQGVRDQARV